MNAVKAFFKKNPAAVLLILVYILFIPSLLSYDHAWMFPENFFIKTFILKNGPALQWDDLKAGLDWKEGFEGGPRTTRPLSSYFEIVDTKFRCWLWHYMPPHPSLSLTWFFSLIAAPLLLFRLLRYWKLSMNTAMAMTAFYLMTPAVMSYTVMLFRPGKPMANFFIILCLYLASRLQARFLDQSKPVPVMDFIFFWGVCLCSFYWDETMWVLIPAIVLLFPRLLTGRKTYLCLWLALPFITAFFYFVIIPFLTVWAGHDYPDIVKYKPFFPVRHDPLWDFISYLPANAKNLVLQTMGIMVPDFFKAAPWIKAVSCASLAAWAVLCLQLCGKTKWRWDGQVLLLGILILFFNYLMSITVGIWGPYYYGTFWSVFFVIWLGRSVEQAGTSRLTLTISFLPILLAMFYSFSAINAVYKNLHYYPYHSIGVSDYFSGKKSFYGPQAKPVFSGEELKWQVESFWLASRGQPGLVHWDAVPRELYWLLVELEPQKGHTRYELDSVHRTIPTLIFNFP